MLKKTYSKLLHTSTDSRLPHCGDPVIFLWQKRGAFSVLLLQFLFLFSYQFFFIVLVQYMH